jgi:hypothetical protein
MGITCKLRKGYIYFEPGLWAGLHFSRKDGLRKFANEEGVFTVFFVVNRRVQPILALLYCNTVIRKNDAVVILIETKTVIFDAV